MLDSGAEGNFISHIFATQNNIRLTRKDHPYSLKIVDGSAASYDKEQIRVETEPAKLTIGKYVEKITLDVTSIPGHDIILGIPWFKTHEPHIRWKERTVTFPNEKYARHLTTARRTPTVKKDPLDIQKISIDALNRMRNRGEKAYTIFVKTSLEHEQKILARITRGLRQKDKDVPKPVGGDCPQRTKKQYPDSNHNVTTNKRLVGNRSALRTRRLNKLEEAPKIETGISAVEGNADLGGI
ncbi:Retroviral aspartyl protease, partial [Macrophomina phaseolina MS6]